MFLSCAVVPDCLIGQNITIIAYPGGDVVLDMHITQDNCCVTGDDNIEVSSRLSLFCLVPWL